MMDEPTRRLWLGITPFVPEDWPKMKYEPKEGDVIERGRERIVNRWTDDDTMHCTRYVRGILTGYWKEDRMLTKCRTELAAMVNHMGWRVLP